MTSRPTSNAAQITKSFTWMMLLIISITGLSISLVVGVHLTRGRIEDAVTLERSLKRSFIDDAPDWKQWKLNSPINTNDTFVKVRTNLPNRKHERFYSPHTKRLLAAKQLTMPVFKAVQYRHDLGFFYHSTLYTDHIYYETWTSLNNVVRIFKDILIDLFLMVVLSSLIGYAIMRLLARRLNRPLAELTDAAKRINHSQTVSYHEALPIPTSPTEVHDLGVEINDLLNSLNQQVLRDHQFVSDASHELRTPLTSINGHVSLIKRHGQQRPELIPKSLAAIDHESHRMQALVESLLKLSRMDHANVTLDYLDLRQLVQELVADNGLSFTQTIVVDLPSDPVVAYANLENVQQMVLALLSNAGKYAPADSTITLTVDPDATHPTLAIRDLGMGIADADKPHIFERFYRVDQARSQEIPGTGLGLAIVARLAELNQIQLTVSDNQPRGTVFTLAFLSIKPTGSPQ